MTIIIRLIIVCKRETLPRTTGNGPSRDGGVAYGRVSCISDPPYGVLVSVECGYSILLEGFPV